MAVNGNFIVMCFLNIEYFTCDNCENLYRTPEDLAKDYATPDPTLRITEEDTVLEPLGHTYVDEDKNSTCVFTLI